MGKTKGAPRNSSTVVFQHKFPFPEGRGLVGKVFCFPESTQGLEIHEEQGWDAKWQCLLWAHGKSWKNNWKSRKGAVLGHQDSRMGGFRRNFCCCYSTTNSCSLLAVGTGQDREGRRSFPSNIPQKRQNPSCMTHVEQRYLLFIIFHVSHHHI